MTKKQAYASPASRAGAALAQLRHMSLSPARRREIACLASAAAKAKRISKASTAQGAV